MVIFQELILDSILVVHISHLVVFSCLFVILLLQLVNINVEATLIRSHEVYHIDVSTIDILENAHIWINSNSHCLVDADCLYSVTWLHEVNQVLIHAKMHCVGCLTLRHTLRSFLQLDVLLVTEEAIVVNQLEAVATLAILAKVWFNDSSTLDKFSLLEATLKALECCFLHLRNDVAVTNDDTLDRDELVNVTGI